MLRDDNEVLRKRQWHARSPRDGDYVAGTVTSRCDGPRWRLRSVPRTRRTATSAEGWWTDDSLGDDGRERASAPWADVGSTSTRRCARGGDVRRRRPGGPLARRRAPAPGASARATSSCSSCRTGSRPASRSGPPPTSAPWSCRSSTSTAPRRSATSSGATEPDVVVTARPVRPRRPPRRLTSELLARHPVPLWLVVRRPPTVDLPAAATPFADLLDAEPLAGPVPVDPDAPAIVGFTSGTTRDPKGVVHSHRTIGFETRQLDYMFPTGGPPQITGAPVGHFIGMLNAFLVPLLAAARRQPDRRVGPGRGPAHDARGGPRRRRRRHLLPDQPARPPRLHRRAPGADALRRPRRVDRAGRGHRAGDAAGHQGVPLVRQHRAPVDHRLPDRRPRGQAAHDRRPRPARRRAAARRRRRDPQPRAPTAASATPTPSSPPRCSTTTAGTAPATSACSTTRATSRSPTGSPTSSSAGGENISAQEVEELMLGLDGVAEVSVVAAPDERLGERAAAVVRLPARPVAAVARRGPRRTWRPPGWPARSGRSRCTWSTSSPAPRRARSRSSGCGSSSATAGCERWTGRYKTAGKSFSHH